MSDFMIKKMSATQWEQALPLGNGHAGAMVYGNVKKERFLLNHEKLWRYQKEPVYNPFFEHLDRVRKFMLEGRYDLGEQYFNDKFRQLGIEVYNVDPYQPFGELFIEHNPKDAFTDYSAVLDFSSATATVSWKEGETDIRRDTFVSYDKDYICIRMKTSDKTPLDLSLNFDAVPGGQEYMSYTTYVHQGCLVYDAEYNDKRQHGAVAYVNPVNGRVLQKDNKLIIQDTDIVYIYVKLYIYENAKKAVKRIVEEIKKCDYEKLHAKHVTRWKRMYNTVTLDLGKQKTVLSNEQYLLDAYQDKRPINLFHTMFNYGKYLFISSSKKGGLPMNLQGIWNGTYNPKWDSDIHTDENVQMCYWAALSLGLNDSAMALYDYFDSMLDHFRENAQKIYGCEGILIPVCMSTHGKISGLTGKWQSWISAAGWIASHYYDYWLFTQDDDFLENRAVPFMYETVLFYQDFLIKGPDGKYIFVPSLSPENIPDTKYPAMMAINATMDIAVAKECLNNLIAACKHLGIHSDNISKWKKMLGCMPEYEVNKEGAMREWLYEGLNDNYYHRHQSHLYPLFPGFEITKEKDEKIYDAIKTAVDKRLLIGFVQQTGWSYAHMANIYARLEDGYNAAQCLNYILRSCTGDNLFTYHNDWRDQGLTLYWFNQAPPFQIDANMGFCAAIIEMIIFSKPGFIRLLPALAPDWKKGSLKGVATRCRMKCDVSWSENNVKIKMYPKQDDTITLEIPFIASTLKAEGCVIEKARQDYGHDYYSVSVHKLEKCTILFEKGNAKF